MAALAEEREARKAADRRVAALEKAERDRQAAGQSELERAQSEAQAARQEAEQLRSQLQTTAIRTAAYEAATKLGYRSPEVAYKLLDRDAIKFSEKSGEPENVEALLAKQLEKEPYLGKTEGVDFGGGNRGGTPPTTPTMNDALRAIIRGG